ncbi:hypothetical protein BKA70DRAFT_49874 [Coprinopsis sp. MPI-PUGE-AT-0042]|nr:hypothetical protein BKA70DRAFT_49874 [Coprinopsis sp. MPI-PUGE-AT-0042]
MSPPSHISDAHFNEVYGSLVHEEDRSQRVHYDDSRHYSKSSGPQVYMPYQDHHGSPPSQGSVNIGVASGNVNTGPVHGSLHQTGGIRRTVAPRPTYPPPRLPSYPTAPMLPSNVPRSHPQLAYPTESYPFHAEPQSTPQYHGHDVAPRPHYPYQQEVDSEEEFSPDDYQERHPRDFQHPPAQYFESPTRDRHVNHPRDNRPREPYSREDHSYGREHENSNGYPFSSQDPPVVMKDRNPFRTRAGSVPVAPAGEPPSPNYHQRAATTDYTKAWVANSASSADSYPRRQRERTVPNLEHLDYDRRSEVRVSVRSPSISEDTRSSSESSTSPVFWSPPLSASSRATSYRRYSPVQEEPEDYLCANRAHSRSSSPGLC